MSSAIPDSVRDAESKHGSSDIAEIPTVYCLGDDYAPIFSNGFFHNDKPFKHAMPLFMLQLSMIIFITHIIHFLLRRWKLPRIVSSILAGILIGPTLPYIIAIFIGKWSKLAMLEFRDEYIDFLFRVPNTTFLRALAYYGVVLSLFLTGVKVDPSYLWRQGRKAFWIGMGSFFFPFAILLPSSINLRSRIDGIPSFLFVGVTLSTTAFPVLGDVLTELRLLNTELGRLAMSASLLNDLLGWTFIAVLMLITYESTNDFHRPGIVTLSYVSVAVFIFAVYWPWARFVNRFTAKIGHVHEGFVISILVCVMVVATLGDAIGASFFQGPILMGLLVPEGSLLGTALVQQVNLAASEVLLPLLFFVAGMVTDVRSLGMAKGWELMQVLLVVSAMFKFVGTMLPALYFKLPMRSAVLLGLIMNFKGLVEVIVFVLQRNVESLSTPLYTHLLLFIVTITSVCSILVSKYYNPLKADGLVGCRNIQQLKPPMELRLIVPVLNDEPVPAVVPFIEACCGSSTESCPVYAVVLHMVELAGNISANVIAHKNSKGTLIDPEALDPVFSVFINYEQLRRGSLTVEPFTAASPFKLMHQDICSLAMDKNMAFTLLPFPRKDAMGVGGDVGREALQNMLPLVLSQAPCSVGFLIYHTNKTFKLPNSNYFVYQVEMIFCGGADDREALFMAVHMAVQHVGVQVRVTRFMAPENESTEEEEQVVDNAVIRDFKYRCNTNDRLSYDEITVEKAENMISMIRTINKGCDLVIVGRQQPSCAILDEGLAEWAELPELGLLGDMLASSDFADFAFSVLVVQHHE